MTLLSNLFGKKDRTGLSASKWCCIGFKSGYASAGSSGYSYLVGLDSLGDPEFQMQFRAVDRGSEELVQSDAKVVLVSDIRIVYCPSCGVNLAAWYGQNIRDLFREGLAVDVSKNAKTLVLGNPEGW